MVSGSTDGTARLWDPATGAAGAVARPGGRVYWVDLHPTRMLVGVPGSLGAQLWNGETGSQKPLPGHRAEVNCMRFSPDGQHVATSSDDGTVRIWDVPGGRPRWWAPALLLEPDGIRLYSHRGVEQLVRGEPADPPTPKARWRRAVLDHARRASLRQGLLCLAAGDGSLELWDTRRDLRLRTWHGVAHPTQVRALPEACLALGGGRVDLVGRDGKDRTLVAEQASVMGSDVHGSLVVAGDRVLVLSDTGAVRPLSGVTVDVGVTAAARVGGRVALGYRDGNIELVADGDGARRAGFSLEDVPASPVERMVAGPMNTLVVGFASGHLGLWDLTTGKRLHHARLHGPVVHLELVDRGARLYAATELGSHLVWRLGPLLKGYCELLREVWRDVPVVWEQGRPVRRAPPRDHPCAAR
jgi:WD40 repeat protein